MAEQDEHRDAGPDRDPVQPEGAMAPPGPPPGPPPWMQAPPQGSGLGRALTRFGAGLVLSLLLVSILLNVYLGLFVFSSMRGPSETVWARGDEVNRVVILPLEGVIAEGSAGFVRRALRQLRDNPPKAVVLRVESGGGLVSSSDQIWRHLVEFQEQTGVPVVASFGAMAASGGYYIAAPAERIYAEPTSITGSIGVIAQAFTVERLLDKIGVTPEIITSSEAVRKDSLNPMRAWDEEDRDKLRRILDAAHARFVEVVVKGRTGVLNEAEVRTLATGEIFTAAEAEANGLVDAIGYLDDAVAEAASLGGVPEGAEPHVTVIRDPPGFGLAGLLGAESADSPFSWSARKTRAWMAEMGVPRLEYRWHPD